MLIKIIYRIIATCRLQVEFSYLFLKDKFMCVTTVFKAMNIKIEPEETTEARTHNLRRRMGCPTLKYENGKKVDL